MTTYNHPATYPGTPAEVSRNYGTHTFLYDDDGGRCLECDCRPSGTTATWPCGADVPRVTTTIPGGTR